MWSPLPHADLIGEHFATSSRHRRRLLEFTFEKVVMPPSLCRSTVCRYAIGTPFGLALTRFGQQCTRFVHAVGNATTLNGSVKTQACQSNNGQNINSVSRAVRWVYVLLVALWYWAMKHII